MRFHNIYGLKNIPAQFQSGSRKILGATEGFVQITQRSEQIARIGYSPEKFMSKNPNICNVRDYEFIYCLDLGIKSSDYDETVYICDLELQKITSF